MAGVDLTGPAATPPQARRVKLLWLLPPLLLATAIVASVLAYPQLPEEMPTHWGLDGRPTNLMPRSFAAGVMPGLMLWIGFMTGLILWSTSQTREGRDLPAWLSPVLTSATLGFMLLMHVALLGTGLGWGISVPAVANVGVGLLFVVMGWITPKVPPNPMFGIRTPRTLSDPEAWRRANAIGGRWMIGAGVLTFLSAPLPGAWPLAVMLGSVIVACIAAVLASRSTG